jgi:hypothetical protein
VTAFGYLGLAVLVAALGVTIVAWRNRPRSVHHGIRAFERGLRALAPPEGGADRTGDASGEGPDPRRKAS